MFLNTPSPSSLFHNCAWQAYLIRRWGWSLGLLLGHTKIEPLKTRGAYSFWSLGSRVDLGIKGQV